MDLGNHEEFLDMIKSLPPHLLSQLQLLAPGYALDVGSSGTAPYGANPIEKDRSRELSGLKDRSSHPASGPLDYSKRCSSVMSMCTSPSVPVPSESFNDGGVSRSYSSGAVSAMKSSSTQATFSYGSDVQPSSSTGTPESRPKHYISSPDYGQPDGTKNLDSRKSPASTAGAQTLAADVGRCGPISPADLEMAQTLMSRADLTIGNPAMVLQNLLGFDPVDYSELLTAHTESKCSYTDTISCYLHNLRTMAEDEAAEPEAESDDERQKELRDQYTSKLTELFVASCTGARVEHKPSKSSKDKQQKEQQQQQKEQLRSQQSAQSTAGGKNANGGRRGGRGRDPRQSRGSSQNGSGPPLRSHQGNNQLPPGQGFLPVYDDLQRQLHNQRASSGKRNSPATSSRNLPPPSNHQSSVQPTPDQIESLFQQFLAQQEAANNHQQAPSPASRSFQPLEAGSNLLPHHPYSSNHPTLDPSWDDPGLSSLLQNLMVNPHLLVNQSHFPQHLVTHPNQQSEVMQQLAHQSHQMQMQMMAQNFPRQGSDLHAAASNPGHLGMPQAMSHHANQYPGQQQASAFNTGYDADTELILRHLASQLGSSDML